MRPLLFILGVFAAVVCFEKPAAAQNAADMLVEHLQAGFVQRAIPPSIGNGIEGRFGDPTDGGLDSSAPHRL
jgi:hypothetical protein